MTYMDLVSDTFYAMTKNIDKNISSQLELLQKIIYDLETMNDPLTENITLLGSNISIIETKFHLRMSRSMNSTGN